MLRQVGLLTAGGQPWNSNTCCGHGKYFAFCATLAVYIYEYDSELHKYCLHSIMCEHKKTISSICWNPNDPNILATTSSDQCVILWNVSEQKVIQKCSNLSFQMISLEWYPFEKETVSMLSSDGKIYLWKYVDNFRFKIFTDLASNSCCIFKWNKKCIDKFCVGNTDGSLTLLLSNKKSVKINLNDNYANKDKSTNVIAMEWDPLSADYILVSTECGTLKLIDTAAQTIITTYNLPRTENKIYKICWLASAPGMFLTADVNSGILRLWSVANDMSILQHKVKETGFHSIHVIDTKGIHTDPAIQNNYSCSNENYAVPPAKVVSVFKDGGVGVYELKYKKWEFLRDKGHIETIFDCAFHPCNPDLLATASFDGTIKVWDINTMIMKHESPGNLSIIYSIAWAPGDLNCICATTSKKGIVLWNLETNKIVDRFTDHGNNNVYHCCWNVKDPRYLASSGADGKCIIRKIDGSFIRIFEHPLPVYGCDWNPQNRDMIATACEDAVLRVFCLSSNQDQSLKSFKGHTAKIFGVKWSPSKDGILCTGSDDKTIRIWDYCQDECLHCLEGHTGPVRGLLWNPEIPNILISGSWDYTLRVWDTRTGYCLDISKDHAADVYGLACHHQRPFLLASSSRDSTVRLWSLHKYAQSIYTMLLTGDGKQLLDTSNSSSNSEGEDNANNLLSCMTGNVVKVLKTKQKEPIKKRLHFYSHVFHYQFYKKEKKVILPENYEEGIMHSTHLKGFKESKAKELETARSSFKKIMGPKKREQQLLDAAEIYLTLGDLEQYCEIMVELNKWEKAICFAPAVSMVYWKKLINRYIDVLDKRDDEDAVKYCSVARDTERLCNIYGKRQHHYEAMLAAHSACENNILPTVSHTATNGESLSIDINEKDQTITRFELDRRLYYKCNENLAESYLQGGRPCLAACCHLAVDNINGAISKLVRGNELELAYSLMQCFDNIDERLSKIVCKQLSRRCQRLKLWDAAVSILQRFKDNEFDVVLCCSKYPGNENERNSFHEKHGLAEIKDYKKKSTQRADQLLGLLYLLVCGEYDTVINDGLKKIKATMQKEFWTVNDVFPYMQLIGSVGMIHLQRIKKSLRMEILALSAYIGALKAIEFKFSSVVTLLFKHASFLMKEERIFIGVTIETVHAESEAWLVNTLSTNRDKTSGAVSPTDDQISIYKILQQRCASSDDELLAGDYMTACDHLPSHRTTYTDYFDKSKIRGTTYMLEDAISAIPYSTALMWACVNPFSPLATGTTINPF